jgi:hypothetical protein
VSKVLGMPALELGHPVLLVILMEADDSPIRIHGRFFEPIQVRPLGLWESGPKQMCRHLRPAGLKIIPEDAPRPGWSSRALVRRDAASEAPASRSGAEGFQGIR